MCEAYLSAADLLTPLVSPSVRQTMVAVPRVLNRFYQVIKVGQDFWGARRVVMCCLVLLIPLS